MMPIRNLDDIFRHKTIIDSRNSLKVIFLFDHNRNKNLSEFIREHYEELDRRSGINIFYLIIQQPPEEWLEIARERIYWKEFMRSGGYKNLVFNQYEIFDICDHFNINYSSLPSLLIFNSSQDDSSILIGLENLVMDESRGKDLFQSPLLDFFDALNDSFKKYLRENYNASFFQSVKLAYQLNHGLANFNTPIIERSLIGNSIERSLQQIIFNQKHAEKDAIRRHDSIINELSDIKKSIASISLSLERRRQDITANLFDLFQKEDDIDDLFNEVSSIHGEFDNFILNQVKKIIHSNFTIDEKNEFDSGTDAYQDILCSESLSFLNSSNLINNILSKYKLIDVDYSVCGIGLWKCIERELNEIFIDWIRIKKGAINSRPTIGQRPFKTIKISEKGKQLRDKKERNILVSKVNEENVFKSLMLEEIGSLLNNYENNSLNELFDNELKIFKDEIIGNKSDIISLGQAIHILTNTYRNSHAHVRPMSSEKFYELKKFTYGEGEISNGLLNRIVNYKKAVLNN